MALIGTMPIKELLGLFLYIIEDEAEKQLWDIWLNKHTEKSWEDFKSGVRKDNQKNRMTKQEEEESLRRAEKILQIKDFKRVDSLK